MIRTEKITVKELAKRMCDMEIGTAIDLVSRQNGEGLWFGIRRLPDNMLDNDRCWIADVYGGGMMRGFSDSGNMDSLENQLSRWMIWAGLLRDGMVVVENKDGTEPTIRYDFAKTVVEPKKNRLACVNFEMNRPFHMYISVPPEATDDEIQDAAKKALCQMVTGEFEQKVTDDSEGRDPFIDTEDINWMEVDQDFVGFESCETELPVGTVYEQA